MHRLAIAALGSVIALAVATPAAAQGWDRGEQSGWRGEDGYRQRSFDRDGDRRDRSDRWHRRGNRYWGQGYNAYNGYQGYNGYYGYNPYGYGLQYDRYDRSRWRHHRRHHHDDDDD